MNPDSCYTDEGIKKQFAIMYGEDKVFDDEWIPHCREKWSSVARFMQEVK